VAAISGEIGEQCFQSEALQFAGAPVR
jgi:hypothetical protein